MESTSVEKSPTGRLVIGNISEKVAAQIRESVMRALNGSYSNAVFIPNKKEPIGISEENRVNQCMKLLNHFKQGKAINNRMASRLYDIESFHRRIADLKQEGYIIQSEWVRHGGSKYKRYWMD